MTDLAPRPAASSPASPRQARARATREAILDAAAVEFSRAGYHAASLSRILERSGVTKGALYFHFASKEAMAHALMDEMIDIFRRIAATVGDAPDTLREVALLVREVQDCLAREPAARAGQRLAGEGIGGHQRSSFPWTFWAATFAALFTRARDEGLIRAEVDPDAMGGLVIDISGGAFASSQAVSGLADLAERVRHNWEVLFAYMAVPEWLEGWRAEGGMAAVLAEHLDQPPDQPSDGDGGGA